MSKKIFLIIIYTLFTTSLFANDELWKCKRNLGENTFTMVPIWILPDEKKFIFLDKLKYSNGEVEESIYRYHEFKITEERDNKTAFKGKWSSKSKIKGLFDRNFRELSFTIDKVGSFDYQCNQLEY